MLKNMCKKILAVSLSLLIGLGCMQIPAEAAVKKNGWSCQNGKWYYAQNDTSLYGWQKIGEKWYYFDKANDGAMKTGWQKIGEKWYYFGAVNDGAMKTDWQKIGGKWYYFGAANDGAMKTGWQQIWGKWYYLGEANDGAMKTGWQKIWGEWYYLGEANDGVMKTGWQQIDVFWYYFRESGAMANSTWIGSYYVDENGRWIPEYSEDKNVVKIDFVHYIDVPVNAERISIEEAEKILKVEEYLNGLKDWEKDLPEPVMGAEVYEITLTYEDGTIRECSIVADSGIMESNGKYYEVQVEELENLWNELKEDKEDKKVVKINFIHYDGVPVNPDRISIEEAEKILKVEEYLNGLKKWEKDLPESVMGAEIYEIKLTYEDGTIRKCSIVADSGIMESNGKYYEVQVEELENLWNELNR